MVLCIFRELYDGQTQNCLSTKTWQLETLLSLPLPSRVYSYFPIINTFLKTKYFEMEEMPDLTSNDFSCALKISSAMLCAFLFIVHLRCLLQIPSAPSLAVASLQPRFSCHPYIPSSYLIPLPLLSPLALSLASSSISSVNKEKSQEN